MFSRKNDRLLFDDRWRIMILRKQSKKEGNGLPADYGGEIRNVMNKK